MKHLIALLALMCSITYADSLGMNIGFGQGTRPFYGLDYQLGINGITSIGTPYVDASVSINQDYVQPGLSGGLQFTHVNMGINSAYSNHQVSFGPELGWTSNTDAHSTYWKWGNSCIGAPGRTFNYSVTFGLGVNF